MSPLSPQVKENTLDPTHGAAVRAVIEAHLPLEKEALQGLMEEEGEPSQPRRAPVALSLSTAPPLVLQPLFFPFSSLGPLLTPSRAFSDAKRPHTSKQQHAPLPPTHGHEDTDQERRLHRRHNWKEPKKNLLKISYQHCCDRPIPLSDCSQKEVRIST